jgi:hypothetical protein
VRRLLVPRRSTRLNVIPEIQSVTAPRIRLEIVSCESVSKICNFGSIADLDIFAMGSQREKVLGRRYRLSIREWPRQCIFRRTEHELWKLKQRCRIGYARLKSSARSLISSRCCCWSSPIGTRVALPWFRWCDYLLNQGYLPISKDVCRLQNRIREEP